MLVAWDLHQDREVFLKKALTVRCGHDPRADVQHEALRLMELSDLAVPVLYSLEWLEDGYPLLVTQWIGSPSLRALLLCEMSLSRNRLRALNVLRDAALTISKVHQRGVVHADLKPDHLLYRDSGGVVIVDWGTSTREGWTPRRELVVGTPAYMAPERLIGAPVSPKIDIYALGAMLYEVLSGSRPYQELHPVLALERMRRFDPPRIHDRVAQSLCYEEPLFHLCEATMARSPERRLDDAQEFADVISQCVRTIPAA